MTARMEELLIDGFSKAPPIDFTDIQRWRDYRDRTYGLLKDLDRLLEQADREELERLQRRMASLRSRLAPTAEQAAEPKSLTPDPPKPAAKKRPEIDADGIVAPPSYEGTDAGAGRGSREPPMTTTEFRELLSGLRDRTTEKRARGGLA